MPWLWGLPPDDRRYYPLYAECVELDIPFCLQVGHTGPLRTSETGRPIPYLENVALDFPELRIVTQLAIPATLPANVQVIAGDWRTQKLSDEALRDMVRGSRFVVLPIHDTLQPAGQSACLQAMACGKAVVLSDIAGLWDRRLMRHGENCILVKPGDAEALSRSVRNLLDNPDVAQAIGRAARRTVEDHLNVDTMARAVQELCL